jgi:hypothetical protein
MATDWQTTSVKVTDKNLTNGTSSNSKMSTSIAVHGTQLARPPEKRHGHNKTVRTNIKKPTVFPRWVF